MLIANIFLKNGEVIPYDRFSMKIRRLRNGLWTSLKGSSYFSSNFNFVVGKGRIRHTTTLKLNDDFLNRLKID